MTTSFSGLVIQPVDSQTTVASVDASGAAFFAGGISVSGTAFIENVLVGGTKSLAFVTTTALTSTQSTAVGFGSNLGAMTLLHVTINGSAYAIPLIQGRSYL